MSYEYSQKLKSPVYEIKGLKPALSELVDAEKAKKLLKNISEADIPYDVSQFLKMSATRHLKFNYEKIAEYYAHAPAEIQALFEESALVIIDFEAAIDNGFVRMNKKLLELRSESQG